MNNFRLINIAEYLSVIGSVAGSVASVAFGQVIYATVPLSLSVVLNLLSRYQFEQKIQKRVDIAITESSQKLSEDIQSLGTSTWAISSQSNSEDIQRSMADLSSKFHLLQIEVKSHFSSANVPNFDLIEEHFCQLQTQIQNLQESLNGLVHRMLSDGVLSGYDPQPPQKAIENIILQYKQERDSRKHLYQLHDADDYLRAMTKPSGDEEEGEY